MKDIFVTIVQNEEVKIGIGSRHVFICRTNGDKIRIRKSKTMSGLIRDVNNLVASLQEDDDDNW